MNLRQKYKKAKQKLKLLELQMKYTRQPISITSSVHRIDTIACAVYYSEEDFNKLSNDVIIAIHEREIARGLGDFLRRDNHITYKTIYDPYSGIYTMIGEVKIVKDK